MIGLKQHIPPFFDGFEPKLEHIESAADLDSIEWVQSWRQDPGFYRLSVAREAGRFKLLMAEFDRGAKWYVIGTLTADLPDLPTWVKGPIQ